MTKILMPDSIILSMAQKRFSKPSSLGFSIFGFSDFGDEPFGISWQPFGSAIFGDVLFGDYLLLSGIYQMRMCEEGKIPIRLKSYNFKITNTEAQQIQRQKYADGVLAWQGLTNEEKLPYNERAKSLPYSGYNLFLKEYLNSH